MISLYEKNEIKNKFITIINNIESGVKVELCTERGINLGREYAKNNFKELTGYINKATICYAEVLMSLNVFYNWWSEDVGDKNYPIVDEEIMNGIIQICAKCSPKDGTKVGAGAGAVIGGLFVGGILGAVAGGLAGAFTGNKLTQEVSGEAYYTILNQAISALYGYLKRDVSRQIDYIYGNNYD